MFIVVVLEFVACLVLALAFAVGSDSITLATLPLSIWLALAILQLAIHYLPSHRYVKYGLLFFTTLMLVVGLIPGRLTILPYFHQVLFVAGLAALPQLWFERFYKSAQSRGVIITGLAALPLGLLVWSIANIGIVKIGAWMASDGSRYCLFTSAGEAFSSKYRQVPSDWSLRGGMLFSARGAGGSGNCCQWDFHALMVTHDNRLFNWSYGSQRFEAVSDRTRKLMHLSMLKCP